MKFIFTFWYDHLTIYIGYSIPPPAGKRDFPQLSSEPSLKRRDYDKFGPTCKYKSSTVYDFNKDIQMV